MCWMTVRSDTDPLPKAVEAVREHESSNGHSWGWAVARDGELVIEKGLGMIPDNELPYGEAALAHTRFATKGEITKANAHPFAVKRNGEVVAAIAHNGTWYDAPDIPGWSDSRAMAMILEGVLEDNPDFSFEQAFRALGERTGETLAGVHVDGNVYVHSGRFKITAEDEVAASSGCTSELDDGLYAL